MKRNLQRVLALSAVTIAALVGMGVPASAHTYKDNITWGTYFYKYGFVEVNSDHTSIAVCDTDADNIGVWVEFYYRRPGVFDDQYNTISDGNGSASGCGRFTVPSGGRIQGYRGRFGNAADETGWNWNF